MKAHKQVLTTALLLMVFAIIGSGIVGLTYESTYERIERNEQPDWIGAILPAVNDGFLRRLTAPPRE